MNGLMHIYDICSRFDIESLYIPATLVDSEMKHLFSEEDYAYRMNEMIKTMKSFLVPQPADNSLRNINFCLSTTETAQVDTLQTNIEKLFSSSLRI